MGQALIALAGGWPLVLVGRLVSWFGKGLRGPLRDAIVAQAIQPETRGRAFGFHRAMDSVGAVVGPSLGVVLLGWAQSSTPADSSGPFRFVLWLSLNSRCIGRDGVSRFSERSGTISESRFEASTRSEEPAQTIPQVSRCRGALWGWRFLA